MNAEQSPFPDLTKLTGDLYRQWEQAMSSFWDQAVDNPGFLGAMTGNLADMADARARYEEAVDQSLERLHLPTRKDVVRLARIANLLEERLLAQEDRILEQQDRLVALEREVVQARVEAAEARIEAREQLCAVLDRIDALDAKLSGEPVARRARKGGA